MEQAFKVAISQTPDDRFIRLTYADWLELDGQIDESDRQRRLARCQTLPRKCDRTGRYFLSMYPAHAIFKELATAEHWTLIFYDSIKEGNNTWTEKNCGLSNEFGPGTSHVRISSAVGETTIPAPFAGLSIRLGKSKDGTTANRRKPFGDRFR